jgi:hypothetical protein
MGAVDRPTRQRGLGARVDPAHRGVEAGARGQPDRAADEPHPDDGDDQAPTKAALPATAAAACTRAAYAAKPSVRRACGPSQMAFSGSG